MSFKHFQRQPTTDAVGDSISVSGRASSSLKIVLNCVNSAFVYGFFLSSFRFLLLLFGFPMTHTPNTHSRTPKTNNKFKTNTKYGVWALETETAVTGNRSKRPSVCPKSILGDDCLPQQVDYAWRPALSGALLERCWSVERGERLWRRRSKKSKQATLITPPSRLFCAAAAVACCCSLGSVLFCCCCYRCCCAVAAYPWRISYRVITPRKSVFTPRLAAARPLKSTIFSVMFMIFVLRMENCLSLSLFLWGCSAGVGSIATIDCLVGR